jgi:hypothetical protein
MMTCAPTDNPIAEPPTPTAAGAAFCWATFVSLLAHPIQVAIIETLLWIERPAAPADFVQMFEGNPYTVSHIGYHAKRLSDLGIIDLVRTEPIRGTLKHYYCISEGLLCR